MKGAIQADHIPTNRFKLLVIGTLTPTFTVTSTSGIEEELEVEELPDRTVASLGRTGPIEFSIAIPMHHRGEQTAMEIWFIESRDPILPTYKKPGVLTHSSISGSTDVSFMFLDLFPYKRGLPALDMNSEGDMAVVTWYLRASTMIPLLVA